MKIVSTGSILASPGFLEKKQKARRRRMFTGLGIFTVLLVVLVIASRLERFRISNIEVAGADVIGAETVAAVARDQVNGYYFWLLPKNNALIYPRSDVREMISRKFPRFSAIALSVEGLKTLKVEVSEREPFALYCHEIVPNESEPCYFIDETGFIFDIAPSFSEGVYLVYTTAENWAEPLGKEFLSEEKFKPLTNFITRLELVGLTPLALEMSETDFKIALSSGAELLWRRGSELERIFSNLESFLADPAIRNQKDFLERVAVLDLRTEDKVFYSFKQ